MKLVGSLLEKDVQNRGYFIEILDLFKIIDFLKFI